MQHYSFNRPLVINPQRSRGLILILWVLHLMVLLFTWILLGLNIFITVLISLMIVLSLIYYSRLHVMNQSPKSVLEAVHQFLPDQQSKWLLTTPEQKDIPAELLSNSFMSVWLVILNFRTQHHRYTLLVPYDSIPDELHRQLRVRLNVLD